MMLAENDLLAAAEAHVEKFYAERIGPDFVYHNFSHVREVAQAAEQIAEHYPLSGKDREMLRLAAWFHDTGYDKGPENHEERSCEHVRAFLRRRQYPDDDIKTVLGCIMATRMPQRPENLLEEILCDADMSHLGSKTYWERCGRVRQELNLIQKRLMSEREWVDFEINFISNHQYYTDAARELYEERKQKHIRQLKKHRQRFYPEEKKAEAAADREPESNKEKEDKKRPRKNKEDQLELKQLNLGRGVETMYRTTYRTHINLSSIADNKANIMLSINAIIISIVVSNLALKLAPNSPLLIPTGILLLICFASLVFAILSTRPKITEGRFTRDDIEKKQANLLFFGNFYNMNLDDFHWGMMEMIKDSDFLYSSMTRDLYYLGIVLAKKYRYLSLCYGIFMYGMMVALAAYVIVIIADPAP